MGRQDLSGRCLDAKLLRAAQRGSSESEDPRIDQQAHQRCTTSGEGWNEGGKGGLECRKAFLRRGDTGQSVGERGGYSMFWTAAVFHLEISLLKENDRLNKDLGFGMSMVCKALPGCVNTTSAGADDIDDQDASNCLHSNPFLHLREFGRV